MNCLQPDIKVLPCDLSVSQTKRSVWENTSLNTHTCHSLQEVVCIKKIVAFSSLKQFLIMFTVRIICIHALMLANIAVSFYDENKCIFVFFEIEIKLAHAKNV